MWMCYKTVSVHKLLYGKKKVFVFFFYLGLSFGLCLQLIVIGEDWEVDLSQENYRESILCSLYNV